MRGDGINYSRRDGTRMSKHDAESEGAKPRNHDGRDHGGRPFWKTAHTDWRVQVVAVVMIVLMIYYVMSGYLSFAPGNPTGPMPALP